MRCLLIYKNYRWYLRWLSMQPIGWVSRLFHAKTAMKKEKLRLVIVAMAPRFPFVADEVALIEWIVETKFVVVCRSYARFSYFLPWLVGSLWLPSLASLWSSPASICLFVSNKSKDGSLLIEISGKTETTSTNQMGWGISMKGVTIEHKRSITNALVSNNW